MDLISQLITAKKASSEIPLEATLKELIKYEKLSKSEKFKHITDNPILQKQLPTCWSAFDGNAQAYWILNEASTILQALLVRPLQIFTDLAEHYNKKTRKRMEIIGNITQHEFEYRDLTSLPVDYDYKNKNIFLTEKLDASSTILTVIDMHNEKTTYIYNGTVRGINDTEHKDQSAEPYKYEANGDYVVIATFSNQGNNDYNFAKTKNYDVSMPKTNQFLYTQRTESDIQHCESVAINPDDERLISLKRDDVNILAKMILKYSPPVMTYAQTKMKHMMINQKRGAENENID